MTATTLLKTIGNTPLIELEGIYIKLEFFNPTGSIKDRIALGMIESAEKRGDLQPGMTIVEATSGNTGISLSMVGKLKGYKVIIIMPEHMSEERKKMIQAYGAKLILTSKKGGFPEAIKKANNLSKKKGYWSSRQFENIDNIQAQIKMAREVRGLDIHALVAGIGTGGTLMGLSEVFTDAYVTAVIPDKADHKIQGIGDGFIPALVHKPQINNWIKVSTEEAIETARYLTHKHGLMVGISSGANFFAARKLKSGFNKILTIFPDRGERYLSLGLH